MAIFEIEAWGAFSPWPMLEGDEGPIVDLPPSPAFFCTAPRKVTTWRTCPNCGDRSTKLLSLNPKDPDRPYQCQACRHHYARPQS